MTEATGQRSERAAYEIGVIADHLGWLVLGVIISIILSLGSVPTLPRFSFEASWQVTVAGAAAVAAALLWYIAEKGIRFFGEVVAGRVTRHGGGSGVRRTSSQNPGWCTRPITTLWAFGLLFGAVVEELFWRGVIWQLLLEAAGLSLGWVVVITSTGFALTHLNSGLAGAWSETTWRLGVGGFEHSFRERVARRDHAPVVQCTWCWFSTVHGLDNRSNASEQHDSHTSRCPCSMVTA